MAAGYSQDNLDSAPAKAKVGGDLVFTIDETFTMSAAVLHFGDLTEKSSLVPTIAPSAVTVHAQDLWGGHSVDAGQDFMVIDVVATLDAGEQKPQREHWRLLPDPA